MRGVWIVVAVAALVLPPFVSAAENANSLEFQQAIEILKTNRDVAKAAALFEKLSGSADRALAARALLYLGEARQKLSTRQAGQAYQRILREFGDQSHVLAEARQRLAALDRVSADRRGLVMRQIWPDAPGNSGNPSADGRLLTFVDWETGDVAVRDLITGDNRRLTQKRAWTISPEYAEWPKISPDGKQVAYSWATSEYGHQLRVVATDSTARTAPRVVLQIPDLNYIIPWAWSPDGKSVLALLSRGDDTNQLVWVSITDGTIRSLKSLEWHWPINVSLSPDGRFLVYDLAVSDELPERDIFVMTADGAREFKLVQHEADDYAPVWTPDGRAVLFASNRAGTVGIWSVPVGDGQPRGPAELVKGDLAG